MNRKIYFYICLLLLLYSSLFADIKVSTSGKAGLSQNAVLNVNGSFFNYGDFYPNGGSLRFYGNSTSAAYSHTNLTFKTLTLDLDNSAILTLYSYFTVDDTLYLNNGILDAYGAREHTLKIEKKLKISNSKLTLSKPTTLEERSADFLTLSDGANIYRNSGILNFSPIFSGKIDVFYSKAVTAGNELPIFPTKLETLSVNFASGSLMLSKNITVNKLLTFNGGNINTGSHTLTMGETAPIEGEPSNITGNIQGTEISVGTSTYSNLSLGFYLYGGNNIGTFRALLYNRPVTLGNGESISKRWRFSSDNPPSGRDIIFRWYSNEDNGNDVSQMQIFNSVDSGNTWLATNAPTAITTDPRTFRLNGTNSFGDFTISDAIIDASPTSIAFGEVWAGNSVTQQITVNNYQSEAESGTITFPSYISVAAVSLNKQENDNIIKSSFIKGKSQRDRSSLNFNISGNSSKILNVTFSPTSHGSYSENVVIAFDSSNNPSKNIAITGSAINPPDINLSQSSINQTQITDSSDSQNLTLSNTGEDTLSFTASLSFRGDLRGNINVYPQSSPYWTGSCDSSAKSENSLVKAHNTLDGWMKFDISSIPANAVIDSVIFYGYVNNTNFPYWSITPLSNDPVTADANTLNADIVAEATSGYYLMKNESASYSTGIHSYPLIGTVNQDIANALTQGWFAVGIATRDNNDTYYVDFDGWNEANRPYLNVQYHIVSNDWITLNGTTSVNGNILPSANSTITVGFDSSDLADGTYNATIAISSNDPDESSVNVPVTLTVSTPGINVTPTSLAYGDVIIGTTSSKSFTIENTGNAVLTGNITTPTDFEVALSSKTMFGSQKNTFATESNDRNVLSYSINPGASKQYNLEFSPQTETSYNGNVQITNNSSAGTVNIVVSGRGVAVDISANPTSFNKSITVGNSENDVLTISTVGNGILEYTARVVYPTLQRTVATLLPPLSNYATGSCTDDTFTQSSKIRGRGDEDGWMKFDLSSIPDDATIFSVTFHGYVDSTKYPYWSITPLDNDPQSTDAATLNADMIAEATSGYYLHRNETSSYTTGWKTHALEGSIVTDVQNSLSRNWIAMGMVDRDTSTSYYIIFDGWNEANKPYLTIEYAETDKKWILLNNVYTVSDTTSENSPDLINVNFDTDGLAEGNYSASISVTSNDPNEPTVTIPVSLTVVPDLAIPDNVQISVSSSNVILSWDDSGANSYKIYVADSPTGTFTNITSSGSFTRLRSRVSWQYSMPSSGKKFYKITSSNE